MFQYFLAVLPTHSDMCVSVLCYLDSSGLLSSAARLCIFDSHFLWDVVGHHHVEVAVVLTGCLRTMRRLFLL